jgi:hypothetical protein
MYKPLSSCTTVVIVLVGSSNISGQILRDCGDDVLVNYLQLSPYPRNSSLSIDYFRTKFARYTLNALHMEDRCASVLDKRSTKCSPGPGLYDDLKTCLMPRYLNLVGGNLASRRDHKESR